MRQQYLLNPIDLRRFDIFSSRSFLEYLGLEQISAFFFSYSSVF
jgi:hypothetical protein